MGTRAVTLAPATLAPLTGTRPTGLLQSRWLWCLLALAIVWLRAAGSGDVAAVWHGYGDTDDATRLLQVRGLLAGAGWYDLLIERLGGTTPLVSHWSRLVDAPLALLLGGFQLVLTEAQAELTLRLLWPALLLLVLLRVLVAAAERHGGVVAAGLCLVLAATMLTGLFRFSPGRIDHHSVMIVATVAGLLRLLVALDEPRAGYGAGALLGLALVVGYEPIVLIAPLLAAGALAAVFEPRLFAAMRNVALGLASTLALGLAVSLPPSMWLEPVCDAIGINVVAAAAIGSAGLIVLARGGASRGTGVRLFLLVLTGAGALGAFAALAPVCLSGPFAGIGDDARRLWLDTVLETYAIDRVWAVAPDNAVLIIATMLFAIGAAVSLQRRAASLVYTALLGIVVFTAIPTLFAYKLYPYLSFIAAFAIAVAIARLEGVGALPARTQRLAAVFAVNQATLMVIAVPIILAASRFVPATAHPAAAAVRQLATSTGGCFDFDAVRPLAALPRGLVVARTDLGPFIAASTHHDAVAAPYHRIARAIVKSHEIFAAPVDRAAVLLAEIDADYVVMCGADAALPNGMAGVGARIPSLASALTQSQPPPFLRRVELSAKTPLHVWQRVR